MIQLYRRVPAVIIVCATGLIGGCGGSGASDKDQISSIIKAEGLNPSSLCDHLTDALLAKLGGKAACKQAGAAQPKDPTTQAKSVSVSGNTAKAVVVDRQGTRTINFEKQGGGWKVAS